MRFMDIPPFERNIEIPDFEFFVRSRLNQAIVIWPEQALALIGYMGWPNDAQARAASVDMVRGWQQGSKSMPPRLRQIQFDWAAVADIFSLHYDLTVSGRQLRRGGPSIGKAIELAAGQSRSKGMGKANLWSRWVAYKDVAHLVTAATIICAEAHARAKVKPFGEFGLPRGQIQPLHIAMLLPDFVLSLALFLQNYGLANCPHARDEPMLDPETLWRIGPDMNVSEIPPPVRKINQQGIAILHARRAGNRGKRQHRETTPVSS
ncbi:MAG: hypothetical protein ACLP8A_18050 [Methylovirgula sp.]